MFNPDKLEKRFNTTQVISISALASALACVWTTVRNNELLDLRNINKLIISSCLLPEKVKNVISFEGDAVTGLKIAELQEIKHSIIRSNIGMFFDDTGFLIKITIDKIVAYKLLDDISLKHPEVIDWLKETLAESK